MTSLRSYHNGINPSLSGPIIGNGRKDLLDGPASDFPVRLSNRDDRSWLIREVPAMHEVGPVYPRQQTFER